MNYVYATLSNQNRVHKKQSNKRKITPKRQDYQQRRQHINRRVYHMCQRYGYAYQSSYRNKFEQGGKRQRVPNNQIVDTLIDEFEWKTIKYFGECSYVRKMGRMDKVKAKQKIKDYPKMNPIRSGFKNLEVVIKKSLLNNFMELMKKKQKYNKLESKKGAEESDN